MKNSEISYQTSTDYNRLYELLKSGKIVVGYMAMESESSNEYSTLHNFWYNKEYQYFNLNGNLYERYFDKTKFIEYCQKWNVRFIDIPNDNEKTLVFRIDKIGNQMKSNISFNNCNDFKITEVLQSCNVGEVIKMLFENYVSKNKFKSKKAVNEFFNSAKIGDIMPK